MRIGLMSDSHGFLDKAIYDYFKDCDEVWHAGDFDDVALLNDLRRFKPVRGVYGNVDGADVRAEVPSELAWDCEGLSVFMIHIGGYPDAYERGVKSKLAQIRPKLFIAGHSHILRVMRDQELGMIHMNPGACGHKGWHKVRTLLRFTIDSAKVSQVEAIELGPRGRESAVR